LSFITFLCVIVIDTHPCIELEPQVHMGWEALLHPMRSEALPSPSVAWR